MTGESLEKVKIVYSIVSFMLLLYGIFLMIYPKIGIQWIYKIGGILFIGIGIAKVIGYFSKDLLQLAFQHDLAMGIVSIVIGILMLMWTKDMIRILTICLGLFMLMEALLKIQTAIDARQIGMKSWWLILIIGLITAVIGGLLGSSAAAWDKINYQSNRINDFGIWGYEFVCSTEYG